jgi:hypothetical protein
MGSSPPKSGLCRRASGGLHRPRQTWLSSARPPITPHPTGVAGAQVNLELDPVAGGEARASRYGAMPNTYMASISSIAISTVMQPCGPLWGKALNRPPKNCAATQSKMIARATPRALVSIALFYRGTQRSRYSAFPGLSRRRNREEGAFVGGGIGGLDRPLA